jgi:hypothetical protein
MAVVSLGVILYDPEEFREGASIRRLRHNLSSSSAAARSTPEPPSTRNVYPRERKVTRALLGPYDATPEWELEAGRLEGCVEGGFIL